MTFARIRPPSRMASLMEKRGEFGLTFDEATELLRLQRAAFLAAEAAAEAKQEGRLLPQQRTNPHGDL